MPNSASKLVAITATAGNASFKYTVTDEDGPLKLMFAHVIMVADATVANRYAKAELIDDDGSTVLADWHAGAPVTASLTVHLEFMPGIYRETALVNNTLQVPVPAPLVVYPGQAIQFSFDAGVAGDSFSGNLELFR